MAGVGISFGNTSAYVSVCRDQCSEVIANSAGERSTSTVVAFQEGDFLTGTPALQLMVRQPANSVTQLKDLVGKSLNDLQDDSRLCKLESHDNQIVVNFNNTTRKGVSLLVKSVFDNLKETADSALGEGKHDTAISIPLSASPAFVSTISKCATSAGFNVVDMIPEPISAILPLGTGSAPQGYTCVVRVGGSSMSATLVRVISGMFSVVDQTESSLGGNMFDKSVGKFLCEEFSRKNGGCKAEENQRSYNKALRESRNVKHNLSTMNTAECNIESFYEGMDLVTNLSRPRFETLIQGDLAKMKTVLTSLVSKHSNITVDRVVVAGGSCKIPKVQAMIRQVFPTSTVVTQSPGEVTAMGAALHAAIVSRHSEAKAKTEVEANGTVGVISVPSDIQVRVGDVVTPVIAKLTPLPCKTEVELPEGNVISIEADGKCLVKAEIKGAEDKSKSSIQIEILEDCSMEAVIKDCNTNERTTISVPAPVGA